MKILFRWINSELFNGNTAYYLEIPYSELDASVIDLLNEKDKLFLATNYFEITSLWVNKNSTLAKLNCVYVLVDSKLSKCILEEPVFPYSSQWNSYCQLEKYIHKISSINELKELKMNNNYQRKGSISNTQVGNDFENKAMEYFNKQGEKLEKHIKIEIGIDLKKLHAFDMGNEKIIIECKSNTWTESGGVPSAKMKNWNEAMYLFYLSPEKYKKYFFVQNDYNQKKTKSLLEYYIETYYHLIPKDVILCDYYLENDFCDVYVYDESIKKHIKKIV